MGVSPVFSVLPVDGRDARPTKFLNSLYKPERSAFTEIHGAVQIPKSTPLAKPATEWATVSVTVSEVWVAALIATLEEALARLLALPS
jgi:hypothetical protein